MGIKKIVNNLKLELFFVYRLLQEGYGPKYWWPYIKNNFLGNYLFRYLPYYKYTADPDSELHIVCSKKHLWMLAWMLRSFFIQSGLRPGIVIHDDGSIDGSTAELIHSKFANVTILFRNATTKRILEMPDIPDIIKKARTNSCVFLDRLINVAIFCKAKRVLLADVDILYFKPPVEVIDFMMGKTDFEALGQQSSESSEPYDLEMDDYYANKYKLDEKRLHLMNGGYLMLDIQKLSIGQLAEYLEHVQMPFTDYFIEMSGWACIMAQLNFKYLDPEAYAIKGFLNDKMVMKHFTSPRRYEMFAYGIDKAREKMLMNKVVITGASGLLGSQLIQTFKNKKYEVLAVFNRKPELVVPDVEMVKCDISISDEVRALKNRIDSSSLIIHCAAITNVDLCEKDKNLCSAVNISGTKNVCELARQVGAKLIYISTASVFDGKTGDYRENDKTNPTNYYNFSKIEGENIILGYKRGIVVRTIPLGLHPVGREPTSFLEWLVHSFKNNIDISLFTDVRINPLSVTTLAEAIVKIPTVMNSGLLHLGSRDVVSKADIGREVMKFFPEYSGKLSLVSIDDNKQKLISRPKEMWLNVDKALSLGFDLPEALPDLNKYLIGKI